MSCTKNGARRGFALDYEIKYTADLGRASVAIAFLRSVCLIDRQHPTAIISSIYFDSIDLEHLYETLNGDRYKMKYRARHYLEPAQAASDTLEVFFEAKAKDGSARHKKRSRSLVPTARWQDSALGDPYFSTLAQSRFHLQNESPSPLVAVAEVQFHRYRFIEPTTRSRISVDYAIHCPRANSSVLRLSSVGVLPTTVVEVKSDAADIPPLLRPLSTLGFRKSSFSKYGACLTGSDM